MKALTNLSNPKTTFFVSYSLLITITLLFPKALFGQEPDEVMTSFSELRQVGPLEIQLEVDRQTVQIADPFTCTLSVLAPSEVEVALPAEQETWGPFEVQAIEQLKDLPQESKRLWQQVLVLECLRPGEQSIPSMSLRYRTRQPAEAEWKPAETPSIPITIQSTLPETAGPNDFQDIQGPLTIEIPSTPVDWRWPTLAAMLGGLGLGGLAILLWKMVKKPPSPRSELHAELHRLSSQLPLNPENHWALDHAFRKYLEEAEKAHAFAWSFQDWQEFLKRPDVRLAEEHQANLIEFWQQLEAWKYAGQPLKQPCLPEAIAAIRAYLDHKDQADNKLKNSQKADLESRSIVPNSSKVVLESNPTSSQEGVRS
ncbi:Hypothetical protein PBC10988_28930 [Planctomycetales bacterium 10988]|nr:Hypothetical protein PBC10988_28930 [Planctomycetales bacterium 10988]